MEKITAYLRNIYEKMSQQPPAEVKPVKVPLFGMMFAPYLPIIDNFGKFVRIILFYSIFNGIISLLLGQGYMCSYTGFTGHCSSDIYIYGFSWLFNAAVAIVFAIRWYAYCFEKQEISWKFLFCVGPKDLKFSAMIMIVFAINLIPVLSLYLLYVRVPNPDWRIEILYFAIVSIGFLVPFWAMRLYSIVAFFLSGENVPSIREVWERSKGSSFRIIMSFILIFLVSIFSLFIQYNNFRLAVGENAIYINMVSEITYQMIRLAIVAVLVNSCRAQKIFLFERVNENGK